MNQRQLDVEQAVESRFDRDAVGPTRPGEATGPDGREGGMEDAAGWEAGGRPDGASDEERRGGMRRGRAAADRTGELGRTAVGKTGEFGRTAVGKTGEFGRVAADKTGELGRVAADKTGELGRVAASKSVELGRTVTRLDVPWARGRSAGLVREGIHEFALKPAMAYYTRTREHGLDRLDAATPPVIFAANHSSHLDAPTILRALPRRWRRRTAVAAAADYFYRTRAVANAFALIFNTVPLARRGGGIGKGSTDHVDKLISERWNLLMFPEGTRSRDGRIGKLRSGAAVIAAQHGIPIVPIYVRGTYDAMPPGRSWPRRLPGRFLSRRHRVDIFFGEPIRPWEGASRDEMMERVRAFFAEHAATGR